MLFRLTRSVFIGVTLFLLVHLTSCANLQFVFGPHQVDPEVQPYVDEFMYKAATYGIHPDISKITIHVVEFDEDRDDNMVTIGECIPDFFMDQSYIVILPITWRWMSEDKRVMLVGHELSHCVASLQHFDGLTVLNDKVIRASIMNSVLPTEEMLEPNMQYYWDELFCQEWHANSSHCPFPSALLPEN